MSRILLCQDCRPQCCEVLTIGLGGKQLQCIICGAVGKQGETPGYIGKLADIEAVSLGQFRRMVRATNMADVTAGRLFFTLDGRFVRASQVIEE